MRFELLKVVAFVKFSRDTKGKRVFPNSLNKTFKSAFSQILNAIMERVARTDEELLHHRRRVGDEEKTEIRMVSG